MDSSSEGTNIGDNPTTDTLTQGLMGFLKPTVDQLEERIQATKASQQDLKQQIDVLSEELIKVNEALNQNPEVQSYVQRLIACKQKVSVVLNILQTSQERLDRIHRSVVKETGVRKAILKSAETELEPSPGPSGLPVVSQLTLEDPIQDANSGSAAHSKD